MKFKIQENKLKIINFLIKLCIKINYLSPNNSMMNFFIFKLNSLKENIIFSEIRYILNHKKIEENDVYINKHIISDGTIWLLWLQGIESAPPLIKSCIDSIFYNFKNKDIVILSEDNISSYIRLPEIIIDKYQRGLITPTHFSDIIRSYLLSFYGGLWIDSTIFISKNMDGIFQHDFYTLTSSNKNTLSRGRWTGYFMYSKKNYVITTSLYDFFIKYWSVKDSLIDYFLIDYFIKFLDLTNQEVSDMLDGLDFNGDNRFLLKDELNSRFDEKKYINILDKSTVHKLSYKENFIGAIESEDTFYKKLIDGTLKELSNKRVYKNARI